MELNFDFNNPKPEVAPDTKPAEVVEATPFDKFDLAKAKNTDSFLTIMAKIVKMRKQAIALKITDENSNTKALEMLVQIKAMVKGADEAKKSLDAYKEASKFKNGLDKFVLEQIKKPLEGLNPIIKPKVGVYQQSQAEIKRRIAQKEAAKAAAKAKTEAEAAKKERKETEEKDRQDAIDLQAKLNLEADDAGVERVSVPIPEVSEEQILPVVPEIPVTQKSTKVVADYGTAKIESIWVVNVVDPDKVGRQYCSPDMAKLDAAVEAGMREIYGCEIVESFDPKIRLSKKQKAKDINFEF